MYIWDWGLIIQYKTVFLQGALTTLWLTLLAAVFGTILGVGIGLLGRSSSRGTRLVVRTYVELFRALPVLVLLIWVYYVAPILFSLRLPPFYAAFSALAVNLSAYVAETVRAGIEAVPRNQYESALTLGLKPRQAMFRIILPQAVKNILPNLMGIYVTQLKNSSLASVIAVNELLHVSNILISNTFRPLEIYTMVALMYLIIIIPFTLAARWLESRFKRRQHSL